MKSYSKQDQQQGIAMIIVLWMLALMTIIALAYSGMTRTETLISGNIVRSAQARAVAESGFWIVVDDLLKPVKNRRFPTTNTPINLSANPQQKITISIQDESGKIDLNKASQQLLLGMFNSAGVDAVLGTQLTNGILDWRDRDNLTRVNGAEDQEYAAAGYNYGAKDGSFNSIGELGQILGMTPSLYRRLKSMVTVHSMQSRIRLTSASAEVLRTLPDMSEDIIAQIIATRSNNQAAIISTILPNTAKPFIFSTGQGNVFSVTSEAEVNGVVSRLRITLVLKKSGNRPITILEWQENAPALTHQQAELQVQESTVHNES